MELLRLRNLKHTYEPYEVRADQNNVRFDEDEFTTMYSAGKKYIDKINNNRIHYTFHGAYDKKDIPEDFVSSISNSIKDSAYSHMIDVLNNHKNITVEWLQVEGTTSDYVIFYDEMDVVTDDSYRYKYTECKNGRCTKIEC